MNLILCFLLVFITVSHDQNVRIVWVFDAEPSSTQTSHILSRESAKFYAEETGWSVRIVNISNINFWLQKCHSPIARTVLQSLSSIKHLRQVKNITKYLILEHYGGLWIQENIVITSNLEWLEQLKKLENTKWRNSTSPEIVIFCKDNEQISMKFVWAHEHTDFLAKILKSLQLIQQPQKINKLNNYLNIYLQNKLKQVQQLVEKNNIWVILEDHPLNFTQYNKINQPQKMLKEIQEKQGKLLSYWKLPKIVWVYWDEGIQTASIFIKNCRENVRFYAGVRGWEVRELDSFNIKQYLAKVPNSQTIIRHAKKLGELSRQKYDLIKLAIISNFGGIWIDSSIILTQDFLWLERILSQNKVEFKNQQNPEILMCYQNYENIELNTQELSIPKLQTFFIAAVPNSEFLKLVIEEYLILIELEANNIQQRLKDIQTEPLQINSPKIFQLNLALTSVLQRKKKTLKQNQSPLIQFKIFLFSVTEGPYKLRAQNPLVTTKLLINNSIQNLATQNKYPKYFLKFSSLETNYINAKISNLKQCNVIQKASQCPYEIHSIYQLFLEDIQQKNHFEFKLLKVNLQGFQYRYWISIIVGTIALLLYLKKLIVAKIQSYLESNATKMNDI